ncbi:acyltransferase family protein [Brumicola nitratireducens]|uniref:Putative acetyltransferase n=1 Tax=Glaciecola nitratireducens (strain JCM 12485 / KCTC 12276 / FR1064) TaxID=1085623 RepID=G4QI38_GLANF|nr:acyltransferase [Glaciecola nitratireducens]AEP30652.1 putative acetyltransferase [Glaciecola nitratireducens FR1064]
MKKQSLDLLTSIRGFAALWVVFYHIGGRLDEHLHSSLISFFSVGYLAVDLFFILSGFVIALSYQQAFLSKKARFRDFIVKRIARIYPLHVFVLLLYLIIPLAFYATGREVDLNRFSVGSFVANLFLVNSWGFVSTLTWNIPSWSISVEFLSYCLFPLMLLLVKPLKGFFGLLISVLFSCALLAFYFHTMDFTSIDDGLPLSGVTRCALEFFIGILTWNIYHRLMLVSSERGLICSNLAALFVLVVLCSYYFRIPEFVVIALASAILVLLCALLEVSYNIKVPVPLRWLGDISFSVYMLHYLLRDVMKMFLPEGQTPLIWIVLYFALLIVLSHLCFQYVEKKSQKFLINKFVNRAEKTR